jgi:hypothetical protein
VWTEFDTIDGAVALGSDSERALKIPGGRMLRVTPVFDTYWRFAAKRQQLFFARLSSPPPWTEDPVLRRYRFTNAYRAADRVSQYLIRHVIYDKPRELEDTIFRVLLFKFFNKIETWEKLLNTFGEVTLETFSVDRYSATLGRFIERGETIYSAAYIIPPPPFGATRKHTNHLRLLAHMMDDGAPQKCAAARSLEDVFQILRSYPSLGKFLAFQLAIDLNYTSFVNFSEMDFVVAGPGACDGIRKCFADTADLSEPEIIRVMSDIAGEHFDRLGLSFPDLWGRKLQLIDFQNLFCEVDKYARVLHPSVKGARGRARIKQRYSASPRSLPQFYPPKWELSLPPALEQVTAVRADRAN